MLILSDGSHSMITGLWGRKIGMTQLFNKDKVLPVTAIDITGWYVTDIKTVARDGYDAVQLGLLRNRYIEQAFSQDWLKTLKHYFMVVREIRLAKSVDGVVVGQQAQTFLTQFAEGQVVDVVGTTKGCGFAGVVRRHGFTGARASHGSKMGKRPGSLSFMRSQGRVIKGKKMPGHMGTERRVMKNLSIAKIEHDARIFFVKGSVPGKSGSLVFVRKA
jgi:large subunit ribosomal protein L3